MDITQQQLADGSLKVTLRGALDMEGAYIADAFLTHLAEKGGNIIVDLGAVHHVGSQGFRVLVKAAKTLRERGGKLVVVNAGETARRVMWTTGLDNLIAVANEERPALLAVA